jgi:hypothetical protein
MVDPALVSGIIELRVRASLAQMLPEPVGRLLLA